MGWVRNGGFCEPFMDHGIRGRRGRIQAFLEFSAVKIRIMGRRVSGGERIREMS